MRLAELPRPGSRLAGRTVVDVESWLRSCVNRLERYPHAHLRAGADLAGNPNVAVVGAHDRQAQRQPQACAGLVAPRIAVAPEEALKDVRQLLRRDAAAGV